MIRYAKRLTKRYLLDQGISYVSKDGYIFDLFGEEIPQVKMPSGYNGKFYQAIQFDYLDANGNKVKENIDRYFKGYFTYKKITIGVHRVVYAWFNNEIPEGMVVDHIDNNPRNNHLDNLQLLTPEENLAKDRKPSTYKVKMAKKKVYTLEYINSKINYHTSILEELKRSKTKENYKEINEKIHKRYSSIGQWKNRRKQFLNELDGN